MRNASSANRSSVVMPWIAPARPQRNAAAITQPLARTIRIPVTDVRVSSVPPSAPKATPTRAAPSISGTALAATLEERDTRGRDLGQERNPRQRRHALAHGAPGRSPARTGREGSARAEAAAAPRLAAPARLKKPLLSGSRLAPPTSTVGGSPSPLASAARSPWSSVRAAASPAGSVPPTPGLPAPLPLSEPPLMAEAITSLQSEYSSSRPGRLSLALRSSSFE